MNARIVSRMLLLALLAGAQGVSAECTCREPTDLPEMPPDAPLPSDMVRAGEEVRRFVEQITAYRECLVKCIRDAERLSDGIVRDWNERVERFNDRNAKGRQSTPPSR